jgi:predicted small lipoprotein YifL
MMPKPKLVLPGIMLLMVLVLQGCGHKGPLFLPKNLPLPPKLNRRNNMNPYFHYQQDQLFAEDVALAEIAKNSAPPVMSIRAQH